jgi:UDP-3-O-[3-hydroxymyristoyl] glucosamine N-acyltransferase
MTLSYTLAEIAQKLGGEVRGDNGAKFSQVASLQQAKATQIAFLTDNKYLSQLNSTDAGAILLAAAHAEYTKLPRIVVDNPYAYYARVALLFNAEHVAAGIAVSASVAADARVSASASIGEQAVIEAGVVIGDSAVIGSGCFVGRNSVIGAGSRLHPHVTVYHGCQIGRDCIVHSGVVIGADGFGFAEDAGQWVKIPQIGRVMIGDSVEIGANTTIDRGALDDTVIENGVKLDNQIQIAHNCRIGAHTAIAGCVGIAGSARIGKHCKIGGAAMILGHLEIADEVTISAGSMVTKSVLQAGVYTALMPLQPHQDGIRTAAHIRGLNALAERVASLEEQLKHLKKEKS